MWCAASRCSLILTFLSLIVAPGLIGQETDTPLDWQDEAELLFVFTSGNAESSSFGLRNTLTRQFERSSLKFDAGAVRVESGITQRTAVGTSQSDFTVSEQTDRETTAENYFSELRFDLDLSERTYAYGSGGWVRNRFAGVDSRWTAAAGFGINLVSNDQSAFDVDIGVTLTSEERVTGSTESFGGVRLTWLYTRQLTETTAFASHLVLDENLSDTDDLRADFDNALAVSISDILALKTGVKILYDRQPALEEVALFDAPGGANIGTVLTPLAEVDTQVTVSLVVSL
jgi:putative salt-induced outer membrane protein YdiY